MTKKRWALFFFLSLVFDVTAANSFDFYVLSLSWSPQFCTVKPENRQCGRGYGLVLHGLWPQFDKGYPESCSNVFFDFKLLKSFPGLYPDEKLALHEWKKHGTCSDLSPRDYLALSQKIKNEIVTPTEMRDLSKPLRVSSDELKAKIVNANPGLTSEAIVIACAGGGRFLQEIYICYDQQGIKPIACSSEMQRRSQKSCSQDSLLIRSIR